MKLREGIKEGAERIRKKKLAEFVLRELERRGTERAEKELQWRLNICFEREISIVMRYGPRGRYTGRRSSITGRSGRCSTTLRR